MRRFLALFLLLPLLLAGCSSTESSSSGSLASITVTGDAGVAPTVTGVTDITTDGVESRVASTGDGELLESGDTVTLNYVMLSGTTGEELYSSYGGGEFSTLLDAETDPLLGETLVGQNVGSRVIVAAPATEFFGDSAEDAGLSADETLVLIAEVMSLFTEPEVTGTIDDITVTGGFGEAPEVTVKENLFVAATESKVLVEGTGATVEEGNTVSVNYVGLVGRTGETFDSSFESGEAVSFTLTTDDVITGFVNGLVGKTVGSRVLIAIPYTEGYGSAGYSSINVAGGDTLIFVVDLISIES